MPFPLGAVIIVVVAGTPAASRELHRGGSQHQSGQAKWVQFMQHFSRGNTVEGAAVAL